MVNKPKLIGISGCTNGGKTTLSKLLMKHYENALHFSQDDFYHKRDCEHLEYIPELNSFNFDVISAIDMNKFHKELAKQIRSGKYEYIFLDGILLYEDDKLNSMLDMKYFISINKEECFRRRQNRNYIIPDTQHYFDRCVWGEFQKYKQKCELNFTCIKYLSGTEAPDLLLERVMTDMKNHFLPPSPASLAGGESDEAPASPSSSRSSCSSTTSSPTTTTTTTIETIAVAAADELKHQLASC